MQMATISMQNQVGLGQRHINVHVKTTLRSGEWRMGSAADDLDSPVSRLASKKGAVMIDDLGLAPPLVTPAVDPAQP